MPRVKIKAEMGFGYIILWTGFLFSWISNQLMNEFKKSKVPFQPWRLNENSTRERSNKE